jgi:Rne/Rng family ribonuclease
VETTVLSQKTAVLEDEKLSELLIDTKKSKKNISNVYRGIVRKKLDGIDACFVDIGDKEEAYLRLPSDIRVITRQTVDNEIDIQKNQKKEMNLEKVKIHQGDDILVQIAKEDIGTKNAKLNTEISISGKFLVYIPSNDRLTISKKIKDKSEIQRLKNLFETAFVEILKDEIESYKEQQDENNKQEQQKINSTEKLDKNNKQEQEKINSTEKLDKNNKQEQQKINCTEKLDEINRRNKNIEKKFTKDIFYKDIFYDEESKKNIYAKFGGFVIRTEAIEATQEEFEEEIKNLMDKYRNILKEFKLGIGPKLIYQSESSAIRYIDEKFDDDVDMIICDDEEFYEELRQKFKKIDRSYLDKLFLEKNDDIFNLYGVEKQIKKLISKNVWLKSGGFIVIEKTEAMTVIDVNSGKFTKGSSLEDTAFRTNIEAAKEIAYQLKLRDIGGMVLIDFIDMKKRKNKRELLETLEKEFLEVKDRRKTEILGITRLGLVEVVRMRVKNTIRDYYLSDCKNCGATNKAKSIECIIDNIEKKARKTFKHTNSKVVEISIDKRTYTEIMDKHSTEIEEIKKKYGIDLKLISK